MKTADTTHLLRHPSNGVYRLAEHWLRSALRTDYDQRSASWSCDYRITVAGVLARPAKPGPN
jgi:hypothetical protein